jgi:hypothetical protein
MVPPHFRFFFFLPQARFFFFFLDAWALLAFEHLDQSALSRITAPWPPYAPAGHG